MRVKLCAGCLCMGTRIQRHGVRVRLYPTKALKICLANKVAAIQDSGATLALRLLLCETCCFVVFSLSSLLALCLLLIWAWCIGAIRKPSLLHVCGGCFLAILCTEYGGVLEHCGMETGRKRRMGGGRWGRSATELYRA